MNKISENCLLSATLLRGSRIGRLFMYIYTHLCTYTCATSLHGQDSMEDVSCFPTMEKSCLSADQSDAEPSSVQMAPNIGQFLVAAEAFAQGQVLDESPLDEECQRLDFEATAEVEKCAISAVADVFGDTGDEHATSASAAVTMRL